MTYTCNKSSPMRSNSDPDEWLHPDAVEEADSYTDTTDMTTLCGIPAEHCGPSVALRCPHCDTAVLSPTATRGVIGGFDPEIRRRPLR